MKTQMKQNNDGAMPITSHLLELRKRLVIIFLTVLVFSFISFLFSEDLIKNLMSLSKGYKFIYNTPEALIIQSLKLAIMSGIVLSSPVIFFNIWMFVSPALKVTERVVITIIFTLGVVLFLMGCIFAYYIIIPFVLKFFVESNSISELQAYVTLEGYISIIVSFFIAFGLVFELPVVLLCLDIAGIARRNTFVNMRKFAIVIICIVSGIITPPDVFSLIFTAIPMVILFELSLFIMYLYEKITKKN